MKTIPLNQLFDVQYGNKFDLNKMELLPKVDGGINFVGRSSQNHGVTGVVARSPRVEPYPAGCITVSLGGTKLLSSFVQMQSFYTAQNVAVLRAKEEMSFAQKLFVCLCIRHNRFRYSAFGREANRTLRVLEIPSIESFPSWLSDAGVTKVTSLEGVLLGIESLSDANPIEVCGDKVGLSRVGEIFEVTYGSNLELNRLTTDSLGVDFVSRTSRNNGVSGRVARLPDLDPIPGGVLTVAAGGSVLETFYQAEPFYSGRDLYFLRPKEAMTPEEMLFYARAIRANRYRFSYGRQANRTLKNLLIPPRSQVPAWVYGSCRKVAQDVRRQIDQTLEG